MTTYDIDQEGGLWRVETDAKAKAWFASKTDAEAWMDAQDAQAAPASDEDIVKELQAIRRVAHILLGFAIGLALCHGCGLMKPIKVQEVPSQPEPPLPRLIESRAARRLSVALGNVQRWLSLGAEPIRETAARVLIPRPLLDFARLGEPLDRDAGGSADRLLPRCPGFGVREFSTAVDLVTRLF
jgi:hypothetical protein